MGRSGIRTSLLKSQKRCLKFNVMSLKYDGDSNIWAFISISTQTPIKSVASVRYVTNTTGNEVIHVRFLFLAFGANSSAMTGLSCRWITIVQVACVLVTGGQSYTEKQMFEFSTFRCWDKLVWAILGDSQTQLTISNISVCVWAGPF